MAKWRPDTDLVAYITRAEVDLVLGRLPIEPRARLRDVHLHGTSKGVRRLGWVTHGRRDITLCTMLPPRVSLRLYMYRGRVASEFGAPDRGQWPPWAVRRKLLYDTLLHELGHMQQVGDATHHLSEFAGEPMADHFAAEWRGRLYSQRFEHPDPIHNAPTNAELAMLSWWQTRDKAQRLALVEAVVSAPHPEPVAAEWVATTTLEQAAFLRRVLSHSRS